MKLIAVIAVAIATPQSSYSQSPSSRISDVNVVNTPNVNVANTPTVNLSARANVGINPSSNTVQVASSSREPVYIAQAVKVSDVFQEEIDISLNEGQEEGSAHITVPSGKLLLIKTILGNGCVPLYQFATVDVVTQANGNTASHMPLINYFGGQNKQMYGFAVLGDVAYADPGSDIEVIFHRGTGSPSPEGVASLNITLSGHYITQ